MPRALNANVPMRDDEAGGAASICSSGRSGAASSAMAAAAAAAKHTPMAASYGSKPGLSTAAHPAPIFAADKLFDEFSLGRINARPGEGNANARIGILQQYQQQHQQQHQHQHQHQPRPQPQLQPQPQPQPLPQPPPPQPSYQPSAPPFECIGRSAAPLYGLDDIFGGVKGVKSRANDDVFFSLESNAAAASSPSGTGTGNASSNGSTSSSVLSVRTHQRSASCTSYPASSSKTSKDSKPSEATPSPPYTQGNSSTSSPSTPSSSMNTMRGTSVGGPGLSRFGAEGLNGNFVETREKDALPCQNRDTDAVKVSGEKHSAEQQSSSGASVTPAISQKQPMVSVDSNPGISNHHRIGEAHASAKEMRNPAGLATSPSPRQASTHQGTAQKHQASAAEEVLLPRAEAEADSWNPREQQQQQHSAAPSGETTSPSSHRKSRRQSATEKLKAVFFPDSSKKEDKGAKGNKGWFTVGDVKLVTQPTDVPPPSRAPPSSSVRQSVEFGARPKPSRDERWRRKSCEFPSATAMSSEQPNSEDFAEISSSAMAMREAVERAEAKLKQKQQNGGEAAAATNTNPAIKVVLKEENKHRAVEREVEIDSRAVERAAHELREKALRKAAERAAGKATRIVDNEMDGAPRSASAPRHRSTDDIERNSKKIFFSGPMTEKAVPAEAESPVSTPSSAAAPSQPEEEKRQRRESSERAAEERAARVLAEKNQRELSVQREQAERQRVSASVDLRVRQWVTGKEGNLRKLLLTLQDVLWAGSGWQAVSSSELSNEAAIKKVYRRATLCLHPDKMQQKGASVEEKLIAEKVFDLLKEAWNRFSSQESFFWQAS